MCTRYVKSAVQYMHALYVKHMYSIIILATFIPHHHFIHTSIAQHVPHLSSAPPPPPTTPSNYTIYLNHDTTCLRNPLATSTKMKRLPAELTRMAVPQNGLNTEKKDQHFCCSGGTTYISSLRAGLNI